MTAYYYKSKISDNIVEQPSGAIICLGVPIARTGFQEYSGAEITSPECPVEEPLVQAYRSPEEVFNPKTIASFEGSDITDLHPSEFITPENYSGHVRGHVQNVRRGEGEFEDCILADLFIKDAVLISKVRPTDGLRDVSCGYTCKYEKISDAKYAQKEIRGNHVAIVPEGRAGDRIKIRDSADEAGIETININGGFKDMAKNFFAQMADIFSKASVQVIDAEPEETEEEKKKKEAEAAKKKEADCVPGVGVKAKDAEGDGEIAALKEMILGLKKTIEELVASDKKVHAEMDAEKDPLTKLEHELKETSAEEKKENEDLEGFMQGGEFHPIRKSEGYKESEAYKLIGSKKKGHDAADPETSRLLEEAEAKKEKMNKENGVADADLIPVDEMSGEELPKNPIPSAKDALAFLNVMRPIVAAIKDDKARKQASDSMARFIRDNMPRKTVSQNKGGYAQLLNLKAQDSKVAAKADDSELGKKLKEKYHRKPMVS